MLAWNSYPGVLSSGGSAPILTPSVAPFVGWTAEELCSAQAADPDISPIRRWMERGEERPSWKDVSPYGLATKAYWSQGKRLYLKDDILVQRCIPDGRSRVLSTDHSPTSVQKRCHAADA